MLSLFHLRLEPNPFRPFRSDLGCALGCTGDATLHTVTVPRGSHAADQPGSSGRTGV